MNQTLNELADALSKAQAEMKPALKDASNPFFKSKYATLESCWDANIVTGKQIGRAHV